MEENKVVSILAKGESRIDCPFDTETWGLNDVMELPEFKDKKVQLLFTFDPRTPEYIAAMKKHAPVVSWRDFADIKYPTEDIITRFTKGYIPRDEYFSNTISYMMAYAIYQGYKEIRMYGVDAPFGGIYWMEKPGIEFWAGIAASKGVKVVPTPGSYILNTKDGLRYGDRSDKQTLKLYLIERMILINILPREGTYKEMHLGNVIRNQLLVKDDEVKEHVINVTQKTDGSINFAFGKDAEGKQKVDFSRAIWMPRWCWEYLANLLIRLETQGKLPLLSQSSYEKIVLHGNADLFPSPPSRGEIKVSYVLTTKNRVSFLRTTLANIASSHLIGERDELIVVDGDSTDGTAQLLEEHKALITKLIREPDASGSHALNKGILAARGEYIKHVPDDDVIFPEAMKHAIRYMDEHPDVDLLVCGGFKRYNGQDIQIRAPDWYGHAPEDVFQHGACGTGFFHRRTSFAHIGLFDTHDVVADQEFALRSITKGKVKFLPVSMYLHPIHPHSQIAQNDPKMKEAQLALVKHYCPHLLKPEPPVSAPVPVEKETCEKKRTNGRLLTRFCQKPIYTLKALFRAPADG